MDLRRLTEGRDWYGYLAQNTFDAIVTRLRAMIGNGQRYTWVAANEAMGLRPDVRTGMVTKEIHTSNTPLEDGTPYAHVWVEDTYGVWGLSTNAPNELAARDGGKFNHTFLYFERDRYGEKLTIEHFAPAGHRLCWVIAPEGGEG